jgi:protein involved in sex pheromone biosynthesis
MSFKIQQQYHKKILAFLEAKGIDYDVLYLRCKTRGVDLGLVKLALQKQFADLKT